MNNSIRCTLDRPFLDIPEDFSIPNQVVSSLDLLLPSPLCLMYTSDKNLDTISDTLWPKNSPDVGTITGAEPEKVKDALQTNHIKCQQLQSKYT